MNIEPREIVTHLPTNALELGSTLLVADRVTKSYGSTHVLAEASFRLRSGEVVGVVGPNGSGKSTLVRICSGHAVLDSGELRIQQRDAKLRTPRDGIAEGVCLLTQDDELFSELSVCENICAGREITVGWGLASFIQWHRCQVFAKQGLELAGNPNIDLDKPAGELSGGQRKALALARALLVRPAVLLLDEPTNSLGVAEQRWLYETIRKLSSAGLGVVIVSHSVRDIRAVTTRVVAMSEGRIVSEGETTQMTDSQIGLMMAGCES